VASPITNGGAKAPRTSRHISLQDGIPLEAYQQGEFDGFCGIYAALNGVRLLVAQRGALGHDQCARLYKRAVELIERDGRLSFAATFGISQSRWRRIVVAMCRNAGRIAGLRIYSALAFPDGGRPNRMEVFDAIEAAIDLQRPVLVALLGEYSHYSVVCGYSPTRLILFDSYAYRWISKEACGVSYSPGRWRLRIATGSIMVLEVQS
jgi:hypothetical protein